MRLLGVSTTTSAPTVRRSAGIPAKPRDSLQPHPPEILHVNVLLYVTLLLSIKLYILALDYVDLQQIKYVTLNGSSH